MIQANRIMNQKMDRNTSHKFIENSSARPDARRTPPVAPTVGRREGTGITCRG
jgi:hypothetical protein